MADWFARAVLHVSDVDASLRFYIDRLGFTCPWHYNDEDGSAYAAQVDRQGCALILAKTWPEKIGKGLIFISLNVEPATRRLCAPRWTRYVANLRLRAFWSRKVRGATGSWLSMTRTVISCFSTIRPEACGRLT